jgi:ankyrin repeat protein
MRPRLGGGEKVVELLLSKSAEVNARGGNYSNALQAASFRDPREDCPAPAQQGAEINTQDGNYRNTLQAASFRDHKKVMQLLVSKGAKAPIVTTNDSDEAPLSIAESSEQALAKMTVSASSLPDLGEGGQAIINISKVTIMKILDK